MASRQQKREDEIERLARETGRLIRDAEAEAQEELREGAFAFALRGEETRGTPEAGQLARQRPMGPLAAGLGVPET
jgi:acyl-CoA reductase-like NAD-dependent aldehyde dehydrogenase